MPILSMRPLKDSSDADKDLYLPSLFEHRSAIGRYGNGDS